MAEIKKAQKSQSEKSSQNKKTADGSSDAIGINWKQLNCELIAQDHRVSTITVTIFHLVLFVQCHTMLLKGKMGNRQEPKENSLFT